MTKNDQNLLFCDPLAAKATPPRVPDILLDNREVFQTMPVHLVEKQDEKVKKISILGVINHI